MGYSQESGYADTIIINDRAIKKIYVYPIKEILKLINSIKDEIQPQSLVDDTLSLINEVKSFDEEDSYELLNKVSVECIKSEKDLYTDFEAFTSELEKEIEKGHK